MASAEENHGAVALNFPDPQSTLPSSSFFQPTSSNPGEQTLSRDAYHQSKSLAEAAPTSDEASHFEFMSDVIINDAAVTTSQLMTEDPACDVSQSGGGRVKPKRTKRRVTGNRACKVCGDLAIAHNFGALTCETCKAFFRRNASKAQEIPACAFSQNCVITRITRRFCAACRMQKCFAVGMDPLLILDEEEKKALQNRKRKQQQPKQMPMQADSCSSSVSIPTDRPPTTSTDHLLSTVHPPATAESRTPKSDWSSVELTFSSTDLPDDKNNVQQSLKGAAAASGSSLKDDSEAGQSATDTTTALSRSQMFEPFLAQGSRFRHVEREHLPWDMKMYWLLREEERTLLTTLTNAFTSIQMTLRPPEPSEGFNPDQPFCPDSLMFILESTLRKCVHFAKTIPDFKGLPEADQIAILKASALETYALRSAALFIVEREAWLSYYGDLKLRDVKEILEDHASVEVFAKYCAALKSVVKANSTIYALLHCIILFDVRNTKLEDFGKVSAIQDHYLVLLKHYLQSEFSYLHASRYLAELLAQLEDMHNLHHRIMFFYKQFSSFFRPLISEFFTT